MPTLKKNYILYTVIVVTTIESFKQHMKHILTWKYGKPVNYRGEEGQPKQ